MRFLRADECVLPLKSYHRGNKNSGIICRMDTKKVLTVGLAVSITGETLLPLRHPDTLPLSQPHIELSIFEPVATPVPTVLASGGAGGEPTGFDIRQIS